MTAFVGATLPAFWAASETTEREPHVGAREQRNLPTMAYSLIEDLCLQGDSRTARTLRKLIGERAGRFAAIERSPRAHPDAVVSARFVPAEGPGTQTRGLTIRDLAETHLEGAELDGAPMDTACYRSGRARLQRVLDESR